MPESFSYYNKGRSIDETTKNVSRSDASHEGMKLIIPRRNKMSERLIRKGYYGGNHSLHGKEGGISTKSGSVVITQNTRDTPDGPDKPTPPPKNP